LNRRSLLALAAAAPFLRMPLARAQAQPGRVWRVAVMMFGAPANFQARGDALRKGLQELGYAEGTNLILDWRTANGQLDLLRQNAEKLAQGGADVVVSASNLTTRALYDAGVKLPVVMVTDDDPVASGFAKNLAHPGSNYTGIASGAVDHTPRYVEFLAQAMGKVTRIGALVNPQNATYANYRARLQTAAARAGITVVTLDGGNIEALDRTFAAVVPAGVQGIVVMNDSPLYNVRVRIVELVDKVQRPAIYPQRGFVEAGGLMSYGPDVEGSYYRAAAYVDRIFKGEDPNDMPIGQAPRYELIVNRAAARALGLNMPQAFLRKADRIIG
jgi:putative ABC transport system substrate-binding protein